jgi:hypothetical protein
MGLESRIGEEGGVEKIMLGPNTVVHGYNPGTQEAEVGQPGLRHRKTLSRIKTKQSTVKITFQRCLA